MKGEKGKIHKEMGIKKKVVRNIASQNAGRITQTVLGIVIVPFLIKVLGPKGFGLIVFVESFLRFFDLTISGLRSALGRYIGFSVYGGREEDAVSYVAAGKRILTIIISAVTVAGAVLWYYFPDIFNVTAEYGGDMKVLVLIMFFSFIFQMRFAPSRSVLYSFQRFDLLNMYDILRSIMRALLCFLVYSVFAPRLYYYGFIYFAALFTEQMLIIITARRLFPGFGAGKDFSPGQMRELFSYMGFRTIQFVSTVLYVNTDMILINVFYGPFYNAVYSISLKFVDILRRVFQQSLNVMNPTFTELVAKGDRERVVRIFNSMTKTTALLTIPACILLALFGRDLISLWVGGRFEGAVRPMYVHILAASPLFIFAMTGSVMMSHAKVRLPAFMTLICGVGNIFISLYCALKLGWGLVGFAFGTLVARLVQSLMFNPYYACKIIDVDYKNYMFRTFLKPLALGGFFGGLLFSMKFAMKMPVWHVAAAAAVAAPFYCVMAYILVLNPYEKSVVYQAYRKLVSMPGSRRSSRETKR